MCRVFHKNTGMKKAPTVSGGVGLARTNSYIDDDQLDYCSSSPPPLIDPTSSNRPVSSDFDAAIEDNQFKFKGVDNTMNMSPSSSAVPISADGNYFYFPSRSSELQSNNSQMMTMMMMSPISSYNYPLASSSSSFPGLGSMNPWFSNREQISSQCCKVERFSSNHESMVSLSQDTGLSADINNTAEISSSKQESLGVLTGNNSNIDDIDGIEYLWNF